jgi:hypothetical protein
MTEREFSKLRPGERIYVGGTIPAKTIRGTVIINQMSQVVVKWDRLRGKDGRQVIFESGCRAYHSLLPKGNR